MKKSFLSLFLSLIAISSFSQSWIRVDDAKAFRGDVLNILGYVTEINTVSGKSKAGRYITMTGKHPASSLTLVILKADMHKFEPEAADYLHQYVHVKGKIFRKKGKAYIMLSSPSQISIAREMEVEKFEPR